MSYQRQLNGNLLKVESIMVFVDCKVLLLLFFVANLWRETTLLGDLLGSKKVPAINLANQIWQHVGSDFLIWIPVAIIADVVIKGLLRKYIYG